MKTPILGGYAVARSVNAADNRLMNMYPEATPEGGKTAGFLTRCPGYKKLINNIGEGPIRGLWQFGGYMYVVSDVKLYKVDNQWNSTYIGDVSGAGPVSMSDNGAQLFIACNPNAYTYSAVSNTFAQITDPDFPGAVTVGFINGYFVFNEPDSQKLWITSYQDGTSVDPLDFAFTDANPDLLLSLMVNRNEIWLFGTTSTEVWYYSGNAQFPLDRIQGAFNEVGCAAPYSVAKLDNTLYWLGSDPRGNCIVYKAVGYGAQRVSTHGIEKILQSYSYVGDAIGYSYQQEGHTFYVLTFPTADATWCFDAATNEWHERGSWVDGAYQRHRSNCQVNFNNKIILGDYEYGKLFEFSTDYYQDDIGIQRCLRSWRALPPDQNNLTRTAHHSLQLDMETGTKNITFQQPSVPYVPVTLDPLKKAVNATLSNGNLTINSAGGDVSAQSTTSKSSGKYYFEILVDSIAASYWNIGGIGLGDPDNYNSWAGNLVYNATYNYSFGLQPTPERYFVWANGSQLSTTFLSPQVNDVVMFAVDFDTGTAWFGVNGVWDGDPATGTPGVITYTFPANTTMYAYGSQVDYGQTTMKFTTASFLYSTPAGFVAWDYLDTVNATTFNPVNTDPLVTLSNGNLTAQSTNAVDNGYWYGSLSTSSHKTGKKYFELTQTVFSNRSAIVGLTINLAAITPPGSNYLGFNPQGWGFQFNSVIEGGGNPNGAYLLHDSGNVGGIYAGPALGSNGDVVGIAVDFDAGKIWFSRNGSWIGGENPSTGVGESFSFTPNTQLYAAISLYLNEVVVTANFGNSAFEYTPPSSFEAWSPQFYEFANPKVLLRWSDDGGHTWSNYHERDMGSLGEYWTRVIWRRLGMTTKLRDRVYEMVISDPVKVSITGAELLLSGTSS